ncbi:hypothetical protein BJ170DRAFT_586482 [Xylariales sp. AK1849]|nr:hypothetical protein BJ170DRAFT_586482 [Xylariales sp. AK1849]
MKLDASSQPTLRRRGANTWTWSMLLGPLVFYTYWRNTSKISSFNVHQTLLSTPSSEHVRNWSAYYTTGTHFIGQGLTQAQWTETRWKQFGIIDTRILSYDTETPLPTGDQRLALLQDGQVLYEAPMVEDTMENGTNFIPAYFGFSANTNISGSYVFCNFGSEEDFEDLARANISVAGKIGIVKLGNVSPYLRSQGLEIFRGSQAENAERAGLIGLVLYTDPQNDGPVTEANGYKPFPAGPARPLAGIERGGLGNAVDLHQGTLPKIPIIPMSYADAIQILGALNGYGPSAEEFSPRWHGGGLEFYGVHYNVGPSPADISLNLVSQADILDGQVHNVIGTIPGMISDEVVIIGNHRDAWGPGAGDPGSGSAALNEVVRSFGVALQHGWRPLRTIVFASFEGEELAQTGSLLWITDHLEWLKASAVAYLNVVVAASGPDFHAKASPLLYGAVLAATDLVMSPNQTVADQSVRDVWGGVIDTAGGGDANRFQGFPCISTVDIGFSPGLGDSVFPYHTDFDNFEWMDQIGDPGWKYHVTSARILSLIAVHLTESAVLDVSVTDYASALEKWMDELCSSNLCSSKVDLTALTSAVQRLSRAAKRFDGYATSLKTSRSAWWKFWSEHELTTAIRGANKVFIAFERQFFHGPGMDGYPEIHHVLYAPSAWHNVARPMPGLDTSLRKGDYANAKKWRDVLVEKIDKAAHLLQEHLLKVDDKTFTQL